MSFRNRLEQIWSNPNQGNTSIIPNGYDPKIFHPMKKDLVRSILGLPSHAKIVVAVGRLEHIKGYRKTWVGESPF